MVTLQRLIQSGDAYDHLFPDPNFQDTVVIKKLEAVEDTIALMEKVVVNYAWQTEALTAHLLEESDGDGYEFCRRLWHFVYDHIQYREDLEETEQLRTPARLWADRHLGGDCDCMSIFIGSVLYNAGIPFRFRVTAYPKEKDTLFGKKQICGDWQHVYVVVYDSEWQEVILDCVTDEFDFEVDYCDAIEGKIIRRGQNLNGINGIDPSELQKLAQNSPKYQKIFDKVKGYQQKAEDLKNSATDSVADKVFTDQQKQAGLDAQELGTQLFEAFGKEFGQLNVGEMLSKGNYAGILRAGAKAGNEFLKGTIDSIVPGGGQILEVFDGFAKLLGFNNANEFILAIPLMIADAASEVPEMTLWLAATSQTLVTDMMVYLTEKPNNSFDDYIRDRYKISFVDGHENRNCGCNAIGGCWICDAKNQFLRPMYDKLRDVIKQNNFYGLDQARDIDGQGRNGRFSWWALEYRKRFHIKYETDLEFLGVQPPRDQDDWQPIRENGGLVSNLEDLYSLFTWVYGYGGYEAGYGEANAYMGQVWKDFTLLDYGQLVFNYKLRLIDNTRDIFTGKKIYFKEPNGFRETTNMDVVSPLEIYHKDYYYVDTGDGSGLSGLGETGKTALRDYLQKEIGIENDADYVGALTYLAENPPQENKGWLGWLIGIPAGTVILILLFYFFYNRR